MVAESQGQEETAGREGKRAGLKERGRRFFLRPLGLNRDS